jgi:hypothetical protein
MIIGILFLIERYVLRCKPVLESDLSLFQLVHRLDKNRLFKKLTNVEGTWHLELEIEKFSKTINIFGIENYRKLTGSNVYFFFLLVDVMLHPIQRQFRSDLVLKLAILSQFQHGISVLFFLKKKG